MITVVENNALGESFESNMFEGMSLNEMYEAYSEVIAEACNEFEMSILLNEHKYLYENAEEIKYFEEAEDGSSKETKEGTSLKDKAIAFIKKIGETIKSALQSVWNHIKSAAGKVTEFFRTKGIDKTKALNAVNNVDAGTLSRIQLDTIIKGDWKDIFNRATKYESAGMDNNKSNFFDNNTVSGNKGLSKSEASSYVNFVFESKGALKAIEDAKKEVDKSVKEKISNVKKAGNDDEIARLKNTMKSNADRYKQAIKVYNLHFNNAIKVTKACLGSAGYKKSEIDKAAEKKKSNIDKAEADKGYKESLKNSGSRADTNYSNTKIRMAGEKKLFSRKK